MSKILIKNGRVWDGEKFFFSDVLSERSIISKIEPNISETADFVFDAKGQIVSAGLVDIHVHMRGISSKKFGVQAEMSCFPFGVTAAADAGGGRGNKEILDSFMLKNVVFVSVGIKNNTPDFEQVECWLERYGDRAIGLKVYFDTEIEDVRDISPLQKICDYADARNLKVMVHSSGSPVKMSEILDTLGKGDILTHSFHGGENNASEDRFECIKKARARGVVIDSGFAGHVHTDFAILKDAILCRAEPDTISTDITKFSAYTRGGRYGMTMCMNIARALGMSEEAIFKATTSTPAKVLGKEKEWGILAVGRAADIAVLDNTDEVFDLTDKEGNRVCGNQGYRCVLTVIDGQVIYRN